MELSLGFIAFMSSVVSLGKRPNRRMSLGWVKPQKNWKKGGGLEKGSTRRLSSGWVKPQKNRKASVGLG